ncbi:MAG: HD domain-containing protein [Clostridiales Family XIII bacterium]|jgi:tRNA nucleotidyltransferase (CCA-adding enzyme)|nr:HD domain-containing protein [Clostridiales Family XIII bacterium]
MEKYDPRALEVIEKLNNAGYEAYLVGGCVRDSLRGNVPKDWDVTTSALPGEVAAVFADRHVIETGLRHGTVTVVLDRLPVEVTTFRVDGDYADNRRPGSVAFVKNLREDLARRDFTFNALAWHPTAGLIDIFGGAEDLKNGIVRAVGEPDKRLHEDGLRIVRALRFASAFAFKIEPGLSGSLRVNKNLLTNIAAERIGSELTKILTGVGVFEILRDYADVFEVFIPEIRPMVGFEQRSPYHKYDVWLHTIHSVSEVPPDPVLRLAMLFHDAGKPEMFTVDEKGVGHFKGHVIRSEEIARHRLRALKYDNDTRHAVIKLIKYHDARLTESNAIKLMHKLGKADIYKLIEVQIADVKAQADEHKEERLAVLDSVKFLVDRAIEEQKCFSLRDLAIGGSDLLAIGFEEGPRVGAALDALLEEVMEERIENERDALLAEAAAYR